MPRKHNLSALHFIASVGEPLNPEAVLWGQQAFGYLSTTTGGNQKPVAS